MTPCEEEIVKLMIAVADGRAVGETVVCALAEKARAEHDSFWTKRRILMTVITIEDIRDAGKRHMRASAAAWLGSFLEWLDSPRPARAIGIRKARARSHFREFARKNGVIL